MAEHLRDAQKLTDAEIRELARIGRSVEEHYGHHQDIEWAYEDGKFYLTQARPVTTMKAGSDDDDKGDEESAPVLLTGQPASPGVGVGIVRVVHDPTEMDVVKQGDVLVAQMTTPDFVPAMKRASAIITERGGRTCHAAIVSRELGIPCVVGVHNATTLLEVERQVTVDGSEGKVYDAAAEASLHGTKPEVRYAAFSVEDYQALGKLPNPNSPTAQPAQRRGVGLLRGSASSPRLAPTPPFMDEGNGGE